MRSIVLFVWPALLAAEIRTMTLAEAILAAMKQNPEVIMARLDEQKASLGVRVAKDPFTPRIGIGSGLAYSSGFPMSIEGSAPSIFQARATQYIFNRQQSYIVAQAQENARGADIAARITAEEVAFRATNLYLDAERAGRLRDQAQQQVESLRKISEAVAGRVAEGRDLPIEKSRAQLNLARARQLAQTFEGDQEFAERSLAVMLGFPSEDRVRPSAEGHAAPAAPVSEDQAVQEAIDTNRQIRRLQSGIAAKELEIRSNRAARLPRIDLVAQYGLFAKFNNYEDFFRRFQRHNGQLGISFELPLLPGPGIGALTGQGEAEIRRLRAQIVAVRNQVSLDTRAALRQVRDAETARDVARLDLDLSREALSVALAQMEEGRAQLRQVEEARFQENQKWIAYYDAQYTLEKALWNLARLTGDLTVIAGGGAPAAPRRNPPQP
jgi:outer membrane protein TolC